MDTLLDTAVVYPLHMGTDSLIDAFIATPLQSPLADDIVLEDYGQSMVYHGRRAVLPILQAYFGNGFPDGRMCVQATLSDGQLVVIAFTFCGRQQQVFMGLPATNREVAVPMVLLIHRANQQIHHMAWYYDAGTFLRQLGLTLNQNE
jgi:steroid delta-isomerase-like uncharacterized protein